MFKILYIEDDINLSETITEFLEDNSFEVSSVYEAQSALNLLYNNNFDLLILDVNLPGMSGFDLLKELRDANINIPTIFTTTLDDMKSLDYGYSLGADDYLRKPFELKELLHRINVIVKREFNTRVNMVDLPNGIKFNIFTNTLTKDNQPIKLRQKEIELLKLFLKYKNRIIDIEIIYDHLWSSSQNISDGSLRAYISELRKLFGKDSIQNIKKQGYKFVF